MRLNRISQCPGLLLGPSSFHRVHRIRPRCRAVYYTICEGRVYETLLNLERHARNSRERFILAAPILGLLTLWRSTQTGP
jgi:hypothetical protein